MRPLFLLSTVIAVLAGCDTRVDYQGDRTAYFAVYGYLDTRADTQFVRVEPVRLAPDSIGAGSFDAQVRSEHMQTGQSITWTDSLVRLDDGSMGHLFYAPLRVHPGEIHRFTIGRDSPQSAQAEIRLPPAHELGDPRPTIFEGTIEVVWQGLFRSPYQLHVCYRVAPSEADSARTLAISYEQSGKSVFNGRLFTVMLSRDRHTVLDRLNHPAADSTVILHDVGMIITQRSRNWTRENASNIQNGHGFFGAVSRYGARISLSDSTVREAGYAPPPSDATDASCAAELTRHTPSSASNLARRRLQSGIIRPEW